MKNFGIASPDEVVLSGTNAKMNELQSAVGLEVLKLVEGERGKRKQVMLTYINDLSSIKGIRILTLNTSESASFQYFSITVNAGLYGRTRDELHEELKKYNIFTRKYFYPLCSDFPWYGHLESARHDRLPQAQIAIREVLSLPFYGELDIGTVRHICEIIASLGSDCPDESMIKGTS
jgi:dTDP-4-amino-4,6-dideoxygalactose transaminase